MKKTVILITIFIAISILLFIFRFFNISTGQEIETTNISSIKQKILQEKETTNNTYYISQDGISEYGTDINDPMPLSVAKTKTYSANDKILLKCGDVFYDRLEFKTDLEEGETIYIGSYGEGEKPIISGAKILNNTNAWEQESENIYKLDLAKTENFTGLEIGNNNIGFFKSEDGTIYPMRKNNKSLLKTEGDFYCQDNYIYIFTQMNPSEKYGKISLSSRLDLVRLSSGMIIENLIIQDTGAHGIVKNNTSGEVKDIYISNCIIQNIGGSVLNAETFTRYGNGIEFYNGNVENIIIENNIIRNTYDVAFTCQGDKGYWKNIELNNNIFILNTQNCEFWTSSKDGGILSFSYHDNISVNTGKNWGYEARPNKGVEADFLMYSYNAQDLDVSLENNKIFNSKRLNYISNVQRFIDDVQSDYNYIYSDENTFLINNNLNVQQKAEFISQYNKEKNSQFVLLDERELEKIINDEIMYSNDYNKIKIYYENLEKEFQFDKVLKDVIAKYGDFQEKYRIELLNMSDVSANISKLKENVTNLTSQNIWDNIELLYKNGKMIINKYQNKEIDIDKQKVEDILSEIFNIADNYINIIDFMKVNEDMAITDLETLLQNSNELNLIIEENSDLDIEDEKEWNNLILESLEILQEEANPENIIFNHIKAENLLTLTSDMIDIYIDEYIQENPVTITYSIIEITNQDVTATLNIGDDCHIINNNNQKTYTFEENGEYIFKYERRKRKFEAKATVNNIDKIAPEIAGISDGQVYNESIKLQITDQNLGKIQLYLNGSLQENYIPTQLLTQEGFYEIKVTDKAGNFTSMSFDIIYRDKDDYDVTKDKICNITVNTTVEKIAEKLPFTQKYIILRENEELQDSEVVATGDILKLSSGREYTLIIKGDLNSDGKVNIVDLVRIQNAILKRRELTEIEELAADANYDKEPITMKDLVRIQIIILNPSKI